jgi:cell division protein ZapA
MANQESVEVNVLNQKFILKTDADDPRYVQKVADFVNEKIFNLQKKTNSVSSLNLAILAALNIADDYFKIKNKKKESKLKLEKRLKNLINVVESHIA